MNCSWRFCFLPKVIPKFFCLVLLLNGVLKYFWEVIWVSDLLGISFWTLFSVGDILVESINLESSYTYIFWPEFILSLMLRSSSSMGYFILLYVESSGDSISVSRCLLFSFSFREGSVNFWWAKSPSWQAVLSFLRIHRGGS